MPDPDPNAFATGIDTEPANIAVTEGLLQTLSRDELQGVIAHEMAHISNLDIRLMTLLAAMVGCHCADVRRAGPYHAGRCPFRRERPELRGAGAEGSNPLGVDRAGALADHPDPGAPHRARLLAMAVSRKREFLADATGAQFTRNPMALASALEKLEARRRAPPGPSTGARRTCASWIPAIATSRIGRAAWATSSPPTPRPGRVARLHGMAYQEARRNPVSSSGGAMG